MRKILLVLLLIGCSSKDKQSDAAKKAELPKGLQAFNYADVDTLVQNRAVFTAQTCAPILIEFQKMLRSQRWAENIEYDQKLVTALRVRYVDFSFSRKDSLECYSEVRATLNLLRSRTEAQLRASKNEALRYSSVQKPWRGWSYIRAGMPSTEIEAGDIFLYQGKSDLQRFLAKVAEMPNDFSELAIVLDPKPPVTLARVSVLRGLEQLTLNDLKKETARILHIRPRTAQARTLVPMVVAELNKSVRQRSVPFALSANDKSGFDSPTLLASLYEQASRSVVTLPTIPSQFREAQVKSSFLSTIGVEDDFRFVSGDLELEPTFEWVAQIWDLKKMASLKTADATATVMARWMKERAYRFAYDDNVYLSPQFQHQLWLRLEQASKWNKSFTLPQVERSVFFSLLSMAESYRSVQAFVKSAYAERPLAPFAKVLETAEKKREAQCLETIDVMKTGAKKISGLHRFFRPKFMESSDCK